MSIFSYITLKEFLHKCQPEVGRWSKKCQKSQHSSRMLPCRIILIFLLDTKTEFKSYLYYRVVPFLVKILHSDQIQSKEIKRRVGKALHNIVHAHPEQKQCKREAKILRLLEVLRMYSDFLKDMQISGEVTKGCGQVRLGVAMAPNHQEILTCSKYCFFFIFLAKCVGVE